MKSPSLLRRGILALLLALPVAWTGTTGAVPVNPDADSTIGNERQDSQPFRPAVLRISFNTGSTPAEGDQDEKDFVDLTLIPPQGEIVGRRVSLSGPRFIGLLRALYEQLAKQEPMDSSDSNSPSRQLYKILIEPLEPELHSHAITTLLISADSGLQAIPYAALHDGESYLGIRYSLSITPSLSLMPLDESPAKQKPKMLAMGASKFENLAPLPLVPQELERVSSTSPAEIYLDKAFTQQQFLQRAAEMDVTHVHLATHAEFLPGGPDNSKIYSGKGPMSLSGLSAMRQRREDSPIDLFVLSACRTALGDQESELGFSGLALQAGSRSAIGTLWYIDDVAASAFFILFYQYLEAGLPKAQAIQATRRDFYQGNLILQDGRLITRSGTTILENLNGHQQRQIAQGLQHPFFWAGIGLLGMPL